MVILIYCMSAGGSTQPERLCDCIKLYYAGFELHVGKYNNNIIVINYLKMGKTSYLALESLHLCIHIQLLSLPRSVQQLYCHGSLVDAVQNVCRLMYIQHHVATMTWVPLLPYCHIIPSVPPIFSLVRFCLYVFYIYLFCISFVTLFKDS